MPELTYREAVRDALSSAMRSDDDVFIMGEDIAEMGGSMGVTQGMLDEFGPERVRNTPISEAAIVGTGIGAAMQGMRPVVEIMYEDFLTLAAEQVINQAAKHRYMSGGQLKVPLTIRTQGGAGWSPGAQHAQQLEAWFVHIPGLKVVFASTPTDVRGLLFSSIYEDNPVIFFPVLTTLPTLADAGFEEADNALIVFAEPGGLAGLQEGLDEVVAEIPIVTVKDQGAFADEQREPIDQFVLIIFALLGLALIIAVLGIVNTLALSVIERTREVGLLRAIGLSRAQLRRMITLESVVISVLGALLGLAMGLVFGIALMYSLRDEGLEVISVPGLQLVVFLVLSLVIGVLAAVFPARRAARLDVLRAISTE